MNLQKLLEQATPLPWREASSKNGTIFGARGNKEQAAVDSDLPCKRRERVQADAALVVRAVNTLPKLAEALSYARYGNTAELLDRAADLIDNLQKMTMGQSYFTPHLRRAAEKIRNTLNEVNGADGAQESEPHRYEGDGTPHQNKVIDKYEARAAASLLKSRLPLNQRPTNPCMVCGNDGHGLFSVSEELAREIVRVCNLHSKLVGALEELLEDHKRMFPEAHPASTISWEECEEVKAAMAVLTEANNPEDEFDRADTTPDRVAENQRIEANNPEGA